MAGLTFNSIVNSGLTNVAAGTTRWNQTTHQFEMFDGTNWVIVSAGYERTESLSDSILHVQDQIGSYIEEDHKDNATIQDAYKEWVEACERFRVIAGLAEK